MTHLTPEELIDATDGTLSPTRRAHLDVCDACHHEAASLHRLISDVRAVAEVPEPSPLFWDHFSARLHSAINREGESPSAPRWFEWHVLAPFGALTVIMLGLVSLLSVATQPPATQDTTVASAPSVEEDSLEDGDDNWMLLADMIGDLDINVAPEVGIPTRPGTADAAVWQLSFAEQQELLRLLREELRAGG